MRSAFAVSAPNVATTTTLPPTMPEVVYTPTGSMLPVL